MKEEEEQQKMRRFMQALQDTGLDPQIIMTLTIATTTAWVTYTILLLAVCIQTIELTKRAKRVKNYLVLKINNDKPMKLNNLDNIL